MFTENANIGAISFRDGDCNIKTYTFEEFYSVLRAGSNADQG